MKTYQNQKIESINLDAEFRINRTHYMGVIIKLSGGYRLKFGISEQRQCCENHGYLATLDDASDFIDAKVLNIHYTETALNSSDLIVCGEPLDIDSCMFITVKTSRGDFQLVAYNEHNGHYGHHVSCVIEQALLEEKI